MLQGVASPYETDLIRPVVQTAEKMTGTRYGSNDKTDVSLRILADHARAMTMLVADGVLPSNEGRGYVLRRVIRRAVVRAQRLGVTGDVTPRLVETVASVLGGAYPAVVAELDMVRQTVGREETQFLRTLHSGSAILEEELDRSPAVLAGDVAFRLHDTHGFPIDLTVEMAGERGVTVDLDGFRHEMRGPARARSGGRGRVADMRPATSRLTGSCSIPRARPGSPATSISSNRVSWSRFWRHRHRASSRSSWTGRRSTPSPAVSSATPV